MELLFQKIKINIMIGEGLKLVKKASGLTSTKGSGLSNVKKQGSGLKILQ